jgi:adenine/guanine phosphoribosyltransferase-like PRPP-binding protein
LETFDEVGIPLADALAERLGMHVVIMAVGPVGEQRGEVRLRSYVKWANKITID